MKLHISLPLLHLALRQVVFLAWVTFAERKWVTFQKRRRTTLTLQVVAHLTHRRLADVNAGLALSVSRLNLLADRSPPPPCCWLLCWSPLLEACGSTTRGSAVRFLVEVPASVESPREELSGVDGSRNAPPGEDASNTTDTEGGEYCGCESTSSRRARRAEIVNVGRSTISTPRQSSSSSIHSRCLQVKVWQALASAVVRNACISVALYSRPVYSPSWCRFRNRFYAMPAGMSASTARMASFSIWAVRTLLSTIIGTHSGIMPAIC